MPNILENEHLSQCVAAELAHMDAVAQGLFLGTFAKELTVACGTQYKLEYQCAGIREEMSAAERTVFNVIGDKPNAE